MLIKYLYKYISKGADRIRFAISQNTMQSDSQLNNTLDVVDEISNYVDGRFICPHEAMWRIFGFYIHNRNPAMQVLAVHLEGKQNLTFRQSQRLTDITSNPNVGKTTLTEWFANNTKEMAENPVTDRTRGSNMHKQIGFRRGIRDETEIYDNNVITDSYKYRNGYRHCHQ